LTSNFFKVDVKGFFEMKLWNKIKEEFKKALTSGMTPHELALAFSVGIFIAFFPLPGTHTIIIFLIYWLTGLNFPVLFISTSINNPWTAAPFYILDYALGYWFVHDFLGWSPTWVISLAKVFGCGKICLWSFFIGGNLLGILCALVCYPIVYFIFKRFIKRINNNNVAELNAP
jgi:uncharacterized protein (DUF2062 family)